VVYRSTGKREDIEVVVWVRFVDVARAARDWIT
jgi:hypothetical protein